MNKILVGLLLMSTSLLAVPKPRMSALEKAQHAIDAFITAATANNSCEDFSIFLQHLPYYRSWGEYQVVAPAPYALEEKVTPAIKRLEEKIQEIVREEKSFWQEVPANVTGESRLSEAGHTFFSNLISYVQPQACPPTSQATIRR